jgi:hypothetical protein
VVNLEQHLHQGSIDLTQLIGGRQLLVNYKVSWESETRTFNTLVDTRVNAYALINQNLIRPLTKVLRIPMHKLKKPIPLQGFDN